MGTRRGHLSLRSWIATGLVALAVAAIPGIASADVSVWFVQGEQLTKVTRPGTTSEDAVRALLAGPTNAEKRAGIRTYIPANTALRSFTAAGDLATIDLPNRFVLGPQDGESQFARFAQLVKTASGVPGTGTSATPIGRVQLLIDGGIPLGLIPGVRTSQPVTVTDLETPDIPPPVSPPGSSGGANATLRGIQQQLASLGYLLPSDVDGKAGPDTTNAVIAFQKWEGLTRDGVIGPQTRARLATAKRPTPRTQGPTGPRAEVLLDRQVVLAISNNQVVRTLHISSGAAATPTRVRTFSAYAKIQRWWSVPFASWLLWAVPFDGGIAFHEYSPVPVTPASHGCVRVTAGNARWLYDFMRVGSQVKVIARSR
jgi:lipoprotein-anchoring transpeptidase ErfK/SrfK